MKELIRGNALLRHAIDVYLRSASADSGPPLGTILGNLGINTAKFCKDFNEFTKALPPYFVVRVRILIFENRTCSFIVLAPSTTYLINILKFNKQIKLWHFDRMHTRAIACIKFTDIIKLCRFKFNYLNIEQAINIVWSTVISCGLKVSVK